MLRVERRPAGTGLGHHRKSRRLDRGSQAFERRVPAQAGHAVGGRRPGLRPSHFRNRIRVISTSWRMRCAMLRRWAGRPNRRRASRLRQGKHSWAIGTAPDSVPLARHTALTDDGRDAAGAPVLASRAEGRPVWGVLRGDVDGFGHPAAAPAKHRRARAALGVVQAVFRRRSGSAVLAAGILAQSESAATPAATISRSTAPGTH